jgi:hypothetical protein
MCLCTVDLDGNSQSWPSKVNAEPAFGRLHYVLALWRGEPDASCELHEERFGITFRGREPGRTAGEQGT